jgi:hypothetical protein
VADDGRDAEIRVERRDDRDGERGDRPGGGVSEIMDVRDEDLEPHAGLRYIARMFKILAILLILLLIAEIILGLVQQGQSAIPQLLVEATRLIVFAGLLWGAADMGLMLIESNHDLRATRMRPPGGGPGPHLPPPAPNAPRDRPRA